MNILTLNAGSSSLKYALFIGAERKISGQTERHEDISADLANILDELAKHKTLRDLKIDVAVHRVVHGGKNYADPVLLNKKILKDLQELTPLAPLHQPPALAAIKALQELLPELPQIACFDTAFHRTQAHLASLFALPRRYADAGIIRYGFHGLSYQNIANQLIDKPDEKVIAAHLGNGASMCAMLQRKSIASSMGFSALDGLMMGTRCGSLDAGVVLYLAQTENRSFAEIAQILYKESGLLGVSGISADLRTLEASPSPAAEEALTLFAYRAGREIGSLAAALGGLDRLVFTGGIGEHSANMRTRICQHAKWLGVELNEPANAEHASIISSPNSKIIVNIIPADEESVMAQAAAQFLH